MMRWAYSCAMWLAQPLLLRKLRRRAVAEPGYGEHVQERFGYYEADESSYQYISTQHTVYQDTLPNTDPGFVWVHAVSLGETRAAAALVAQLRTRLPGMRLLLTHGTDTGRKQGLALLKPGDVQVWQPWDTPGAVQRFLAHFQPRIGLLMETEVWPNLVAGCKAAGVPLCLVNARLSAKSLRKARRVAWLSVPAFKGLRAVWAQSEDDAARLRELGAQVQGVMGNFKYDLAPDAAQLVQGRALRQRWAKPVVMFASSREGEEQLWLDICKKNRPLALVESAQAATKTIATSEAQSAVQWLIVPRHPQRFDEVAALCEAQGLTVSRRSSWSRESSVAAGNATGTAAALAPGHADVWLGDSLGEMALYYGLADVALLGGSFAPLGGQNLIEAAASGCPVVMGPHTFNFAEAAVLAQAAGAAFEQADLAQAVEKACALAKSPTQLDPARQAALALSLAHRGAAQRTAQAIQALLGASTPR